MIKCILIDNDSESIKRLALELANFTDKIKIIGKFTSVEIATEFIRKTEVQLAFINVETPQMSAIQLIARFPAVHFQPIFSTLHSEYAIEAIKKNKVTYLLKPIDGEELRNCIKSFIKSFEKSNNKVENILLKTTEVNNPNKKIKIYTEGKIFFFEPEEIIYCQAAGSYTHIFLTSNRKILVSQRLKSVGNWLPEIFFIRVHHSYIVNIYKITEFNLSKNSLLLDQETSVPVSRLRKKEVLKKLS